MEMKPALTPTSLDSAGKALLNDLRNCSEVVGGGITRNGEGTSVILIRLSKQNLDLQRKYSQYAGYPVNFQIVTASGFHAGVCEKSA